MATIHTAGKTGFPLGMAAIVEGGDSSRRDDDKGWYIGKGLPLTHGDGNIVGALGCTTLQAWRYGKWSPPLTWIVCPVI